MSHLNTALRLLIAFSLPPLAVIGDLWANSKFALPVVVEWALMAIAIIVGALILLRAQWRPMSKACALLAYVPLMIGLVVVAGLSAAFP